MSFSMLQLSRYRRNRCAYLIPFLVLALFSIPVSLRECRALDLANPAKSQLDSDHDGLSDELEQALLEKFVPSFMISGSDCSNIPAEFQKDNANPSVLAENGTIYGQVSPAKNSANGTAAAEIHYFHLWRSDCGRHGHPLDTEHVSVLVRAPGANAPSEQWKAAYWYAAAHENTACDASQIARASAVQAEESGARVWISGGKHASYLNEKLCTGGCGADRCEQMTALAHGKILNLGEPEFPMNGSSFIASKAWPLGEKMGLSNFPESALVRVNGLAEKDNDIVWFNAGKHPAQGIIAISSTTERAIAGGGKDSINGISVAANASGNALSTVQDSSGNALQKSYRHTKRALGTSFHHIGEALGVVDEKDSY